jgi:outer membrane receptor for monomeric catechols
MRIQHEFSANAALALDVLNLLDRQYYDISYKQDYRISPLRPITAGGITVHPGEPRQIRLTLMLRG